MSKTLDEYKKYGVGSIVGALSAAASKFSSSKPTSSIPPVSSANPTGGTSSSAGSGNPQLDALEKNYEMQSQNALAKYETASKELERSRANAVKNATANNAKLMKYMPSILKRQGLSGLGVSQSAVINASNNFAGQLTDIEDNYQKNSADLLSNYNDAKLAYDTQYNTQKAQLEQKALDEEKAEKEKAEAEAKAKNNEIAGNLESMINGSAATTIDELVAELGITLGEGQDFNAYIDSLGVESHVASYLKSLAAQKVSDNNKGKTDKGIADAFNRAKDLITGDDISTDFTEILSEAQAAGVSGSDYNYLLQLAKQQVAINEALKGDKTLQEWRSAFENAWEIIAADNVSEDFSDVLSKFTVGENITESDYDLLQMLAASKVTENKLANNSEVKDTALLEISALCLEEKYKEASEILEANKAIIGEGMYSYYKSIINPKLQQGGKSENVYDDMTDEEVKELTIDGKLFVSDGVNDYRLKKPLADNANELYKNNDFTRQLEEKCGTNNPYALDKIPNGTTFEIRCDAEGKNKFNFGDILPYIPLGGVLSSAILAIIENGNPIKKTVTFYDGVWYISENKGETQKKEQN